MKRTIFLFLIFLPKSFAQPSANLTKDNNTPWFAIFIAVFVLVILFSGVLVQKRWKERNNS